MEIQMGLLNLKLLLTGILLRRREMMITKMMMKKMMMMIMILPQKITEMKFQKPCKNLIIEQMMKKMMSF